MNLTDEQKHELADAAKAALMALNPAAAGSIAALAMVATQFMNLVHGIRTKNPEAWNEVRADFTEASDAFDDALAAHQQTAADAASAST